jgi:hypothetical protein
MRRKYFAVTPNAKLYWNGDKTTKNSPKELQLRPLYAEYIKGQDLNPMNVDGHIRNAIFMNVRSAKRGKLIEDHANAARKLANLWDISTYDQCMLRLRVESSRDLRIA